ncbi:eukaryotic translation initiation factor 5B-like isoform X2 [Epinephelus fuscoguttatus]|uniref:eukaryotic translation initiation factor 5B-like isoform X2 n=1 Tax=Epinephelus fuscoguttatus TaxID=293821 RepID=UPI0020D12309|nr:eukaryotic translation initiation factor 5B-like isoform X2 [Epinephelus fuscoguttatus]
MAEASSDTSSPEPDLRGRKTEQSQFLSTVIVMEQERRLEELGKFLAVCADEMTGDLAGEAVEEQEKKEKMKIPKLKDNSALAKQTPGSPKRRMSLVERVTVKKDPTFDFLVERATLQKSLMKKRSEIMRMDKAIEAKEQLVKKLEQKLEMEEQLEKQKKKSADAKILFEEMRKSKLELNSAIEKLTDEVESVKSEAAQLEDTLDEYKQSKNILLKMLTPEWHEAHEAENSKAEVLSDRDTQIEPGREPHESAVRQGLESSPGKAPPSTTEPTLSSTHNDTLVSNSKLDSDSSDYEEKLEQYLRDPQQLLDAMMEVKDQILSLASNCTTKNKMLEELEQMMEAASKKTKVDDEQLMLQINDTEDRISKEKKQAANLKMMLQFHHLLKTEDQDAVLDALRVKVTEVYCCCMGKPLASLSTLEKLSSVEYRMTSLLEQMDSMPKGDLKTLRQIRGRERRNRLHEEKRRREMEKRKEREQRCIQRAVGDAKKISGRKLMPRCFPVKQKTEVSNEDNIPSEDDLHAYMFGTEDLDKDH